MKLRMYSVRDVKMGVFLAPFFSRNDVDAARQIANAMKDPSLANSPMVMSPNDFEMHCVGCFDDELGELESFPRSEAVFPLCTVSS